MTTGEARALAMAGELYNLLVDLFDLPKHGPGSYIEVASNRMENVIGCLSPMRTTAVPGRGRQATRALKEFVQGRWALMGRRTQFRRLSGARQGSGAAGASHLFRPASSSSSATVWQW